MDDGIISYSPTEGLSYDPNDRLYWDKGALSKEVVRVFEVCHGCRMCFKYCTVFPNLFDYIDNKYDGSVSKITEAETDKLMSECFHCKLCEVNCPYTVRDNHSFLLDFPKLVNRYMAVKFKEKGMSFRDRILASANAVGKLFRASLGLANYLNKLFVVRWIMEKTLGIHREKLLPPFATTTFESWLASNEKLKESNTNYDAVLFHTCYVQNNEPQIGIDTVEVMERNDINLACSKGFECCGMPYWEKGDLDTVRKLAEKNISKLYPYVENGAKVIAINPTCNMMFKNEYPYLVERNLQEKANKISENVYEPSGYLWSLRNSKALKPIESDHEGDIAFHVPCHTRHTYAGFPTMDLILKLSSKRLKTVMECSGHDGTYALKKETYKNSIKYGKRSFDAMKSKDCKVWISDCPMAATQFRQHAGNKAFHSMTYIAGQYRGDEIDDMGEDN